MHGSVHNPSREAATDQLSAMKWLKKRQKNMIQLFEDRNVSELKTNRNTAFYLKNVQLFMNIYFKNEGHKTFRWVQKQQLLMMPVFQSSE